jgi:uncharacterized membrane protein YebE (DUF533 family)
MSCFHSTQSRRLIRLVGGVEAAASICGVSAQLMSNYQNAGQRAFMPPQFIEALEREAGQPVYSSALSNLVTVAPSRSMLCDAMDAARIAGGLPQQVHEALSDGRIDEAERRALLAAVDQLRAEADAVAASLSLEG